MSLRSASAQLLLLTIMGCSGNDGVVTTFGSAGNAGGGMGSGAGASSIPAEVRALALEQTPTLPPDVSNRFADRPDAAIFGQRLFFEPGFSGALLDGDNDGSERALGKRGDTGKVACAACHVPNDAFTDTRSLREQISLAAGWGKRRAPSLLDVAQSKLLMWDGRRDGLYNQVFGVIESPVEMNSSRLYAAKQAFVLHRGDYEAVFGPMPPLDDAARFPNLPAGVTGCSKMNEALRECVVKMHGQPGDGAEFDQMAPADQDAVTQVVVNLGKAMGAYERLLSCGESRFDRWARGEDSAALTADEQRGALLFAGKAKCASCHSGPYLSDEKFHNVGLKPALVATVFIDSDDSGGSVGLAASLTDPLNTKGKYGDGDDGRLSLTLGPDLVGSFRTPRLRCISKRPSFMHTGQLTNLSDVVSFFDRGGDHAGFPGKSELAPLNLTTEERADIVTFLLSLEGPGPAAALLRAP